MSEEAFNFVKQEVAYPEFHFSAGQQSISVRRLEDIRRTHAKKEVPSDKTHNFPQTTREDTQGLQQVCRQKVLEVATQQTPELSQLVPVADTDQVNDIAQDPVEKDNDQVTEASSNEDDSTNTSEQG